MVLQDHGEDGASEVAEETSVMVVDDADVAVQQHSQQFHRDIPFEFVDDDEMAAIEIAMLQAHSVSSAYHSIALPHSIDVASAHRNSISGNQHISNDSSTKVGTQSPAVNKPETLFAYTVTSARFRAPNGSVSSATASARISAARQGSPSAGLEDVCSSQSPEDMCTASLETLSENDQPVNTTNSSFASESVVQGQISGDSQDIEDLCGSSVRVSPDGQSSGSSAKREGASERAVVTLLKRKSERGLSVTDFTASEWCEKQVEFSLNRGRPAQTPAMKAGSVRHVELEREVVTRVDIEIFTKEDSWAVRLLNFISGARQLLSEGLTRELPVVGLVGPAWVVGIIDEIRLVPTECGDRPLLVDTKTRTRRLPPSEPQKRNARLQLMCYKLLWDNMVEDGLPLEPFLKHFRLKPQQEFCQDVKAHAASLWVDCKVQCLEDLLPQIMKDLSSQIHSKSVDALLLRYEWQEDQSLLGEDEFLYEHDWLMDRWAWHSDFWSGRRAASYVPDDEAWKCRYCSFASVCRPSQQSAGGSMKAMQKDMKQEKIKDTKENIKEEVKDLQDIKQDTKEDIKEDIKENDMQQDMTGETKENVSERSLSEMNETVSERSNASETC